MLFERARLCPSERRTRKRKRVVWPLPNSGVIFHAQHKRGILVCVDQHVVASRSFLFARARTQVPENPARVGDTRAEAPFFAIPTSFGTGSEVNGDAVLLDNVTGEAFPLHSPNLASTAVFVDKQNFAGLTVCMA